MSAASSVTINDASFTERPSWDDVWMTMAHVLAQRSPDPTFKVGGLIVTSDNARILGIGYNGSYRGGPNEPESLERGQSGFVHCEVNACIKSDFHYPLLRRMYITLSPCAMCAKVIVNAGLSEVIFFEEYRGSSSGFDVLRHAGIPFRQHCGKLIVPHTLLVGGSS